MAMLYRVILPVNDIERAATFYGAVLNTPGMRVSPGRHYFDCGGTILACYDPIADGDGNPGPHKPHPLQYLYFAVPDLEATLARVSEAGGIIDKLIATMPWGERLFYGRDPFNNLISFVDDRTVFKGLLPSAPLPLLRLNPISRSSFFTQPGAPASYGSSNRFVNLVRKQRNGQAPGGTGRGGGGGKEGGRVGGVGCTSGTYQIIWNVYSFFSTRIGNGAPTGTSSPSAEGVTKCGAIW